MRLFNWISLALAGTGLSYGVSRKRNNGRRYMAAQTRATTYTYTSMATGINGVFTECTLDNLQVICTCDTAVEPPVTTIPPKQPAPIIYIVAIVNDDGIGALYTHVESFYNKMIQSTANMEVQPEFRLVHRDAGEGLRPRRSRAASPSLTQEVYFTCKDDSHHRYIVTDIATCEKENNNQGFHDCFHKKVPDSANVICVGNAYHAMYEDLLYSNAQSSSNRTALQFSVHPFSSQHEGRFAAGAVYKFEGGYDHVHNYTELIEECNRPDLFADSALIITDARYANGQWKDSFRSTNRKAWSELNRCALKNAQMADEKYGGTPRECANYLNVRQAEYLLTDVSKRNECPMIPDFGKANGKSAVLPVEIAKQFAATIR